MVEILCTVTGIIAGSAAVATIMHQQAERERSLYASHSSVEESLRLKVLADQLQSLTTRVSADVTAHSERVSSINGRLDPADQDPEAILSAINELIAANAAMHGQLAEAQNQIHQQSQQIEQTATEARTDSLTGLANRRALNEYLHGCIEPARSAEVTALFMLDVDHFKSCNDTHGHLAGDAVLAMFAKRISQWCQDRYYAARYGGEEFAVILNGNSIGEVVHQAAELRASISNKPITYLDLTLKLTASGGLTQLRQGETIETAYHRADEGLYLAKKNGRNCGFWLSADEWLRMESNAVELEEVAETAQPLPSPQASQTSARAVAKSEVASAQPASPTLSRAEDEVANPVAKLSAEVVAVTPPNAMKATEHNESTADVLDLNVFLQRLEVHFAQLGRANLPATAMMLEAVGLNRGSPQTMEACWANTLALIQSHVRGIDVICRINQVTLCIFMPGSQMDVSLDRASRMQQGLTALRKDTSLAGPFPDRLSIALASVVHKENPGFFMQRLEAALDEARNSQDDELIIHDGQDCRPQLV